MSAQQPLSGEEENEFNTEALAMAIAEAADQRKAENIKILDVRGMLSYADYLVVCQGGSTPHVRAIADFVVEDLRPLKVRPRDIEGARAAEWVLVDFMDVVLHVFRGEAREEYAIESIWHDAPRVAWEDEEEDDEDAVGDDASL